MAEVTEKLIEKYSERVQRGHRWLNMMRPDWYRVVDTEQLIMNDTNTCIIAQVFDTTYIQFREKFNFSTGKMIEFGFTIELLKGNDEHHWLALEEAQRRLIRQRVEADYGIAR